MTAEILVPQRGVDRLARSTDLPMALCPDDASVADGAVVALTSRRFGAMGLAVADRTAQCWRVLARGAEGVAAVDDAFLDRRLTAATALRRDHGLGETGSAYRLLNGAGDRLPGVLADVYGDFAVVSALTPAMTALAGQVARRLVARETVRGVVVKRRERGGASGGPAVIETCGEAPPPRVVVREGRWQFEAHLATGVNVGLFTDMRLERERIFVAAANRRVLNLFAYTGALSVAAASGGATHVTSVDVSAGVLAWARDHFALNGLPESGHDVVAEDVARYVSAAQASGRQFDLVLIDPPSYSAARDAAFAVDRDYPGLVAGACRLLPPGGALWLASNARGFSLVGAAQSGIAAAGRDAVVVAEGGLPADYPTELSDGDARYLQTLLLRLA